MSYTKCDWTDYLCLLGKLGGYVEHGIENSPSNSIFAIIGIERGGIIPAVYMSHKFDDIPFISFNPRILTSNGQCIRASYQFPLFAEVISGNILLVDDICDSGKTFEKCKKYFENLGFNCLTASVYLNRERANFMPDWWAKDSKQCWIEFPYEVQKK